MSSAAGAARLPLTYPFVLVRICCPRCMRRDRFRLARLARQYSEDISLDRLLARLTRDCKHRADDDPRRRVARTERVRCEARYCDLPLSPRPSTCRGGLWVWNDKN